MDNNISLTKVIVSTRKKRMTEKGLALDDKVRSFTVERDNCVRKGDVGIKFPSFPIKRAEFEFSDGSVYTLEYMYEILRELKPGEEVLNGGGCEKDMSLDFYTNELGSYFEHIWAAYFYLIYDAEIWEDVNYYSKLYYDYLEYLRERVSMKNRFQKHHGNRSCQSMKNCFRKPYYNRPRESRMKKTFS